MDTNAFDGVSFIWGTSVAKPSPWHSLDSGNPSMYLLPNQNSMAQSSAANGFALVS